MSDSSDKPQEDKDLYGLITGGTRGIGYGIATELAKKGYNLIHLNETAANEARKELTDKYGVKVYTVKGDVAEESTVDAYFEAVQKYFGNKLTAFVHNSGLKIGLTTESVSDQAKKAFKSTQPQAENIDRLDFSVYDYYQEVYPKCFQRCIEKAIKLMSDGNGYIVGISSPGCNSNSAPRPSYLLRGTGKCVMEFLNRYYARILAPRKITCNILIPGYTKTQVWDKLQLPMDLDEWIKERVPMQRWGTPEDVGRVVAFLCSKDGSFITGTALQVDGGLHLM